MKANLEKKKTGTTNMKSTEPINSEPKMSDEQLISIFSTGEKVEKTPRIINDKSNKKKNKKK